MSGSTGSASQAHARPLRMRLLMLAASGLLPLLMVLGWGINHLIEERRHQAEQVALDLSRALANAIDTEHRSIIALLDHMGTSDDLERADFRNFHLSARRTAAQLGWLSVVLDDADGRAILRTSHPYDSTAPITIDAQSLRQVIDTRMPAVSGLVAYRTTAPDTFIIRTPVVRGDKLVYVLSAYLPTEMVLAVLDRQRIPAGSIASVFDKTHYRIARSLGTPSRQPSPSMQALLDRGEPSGVGETSTREGVRNYTGYTRLPLSGWIVTVGSSIAEVNRGLHALLQAIALGTAASLGLAAGLAWIVSRQVLGPIDTLKRGAAALGRGEPVTVAPLEIEELNDVASALNHAATDRDRAAQHEDAADTCAALLEMCGYSVRTVYRPETALESLGEFKPDVAILDIGLPGISGYTLAMRMKDAGYRGALVALTGYGQASDLAASRAAGFHAHLTKPVTPTELIELVDRLARGQREIAASSLDASAP